MAWLGCFMKYKASKPCVWVTLKVKSNGDIWLPIYDFLLMYNSNHMAIPHHLAVFIALKKFLGQNYRPPDTHLYPKSLQRGSLPPRTKLVS